MSFTDQKPWTVTAEDVRAPWGGYRDGRAFRCFLCGHAFRVGDVARWVLTNVSGSRCQGNPFVCAECDSYPCLMDRLAAHYADGHRRFWWMREEPHTVSTAEKLTAALAEHGGSK